MGQVDEGRPGSLPEDNSPGHTREFILVTVIGEEKDGAPLAVRHRQTETVGDSPILVIRPGYTGYPAWVYRSDR